MRIFLLFWHNKVVNCIKREVTRKIRITYLKVRKSPPKLTTRIEGHFSTYQRSEAFVVLYEGIYFRL